MAQGQRPARVAELIQREAARVLLEEVDDELLRGATITGVQLSRDLRYARILFTAGAGQKAELERHAKRFEPFLQRELARRVRLRYAVQVALVYDGGLDHAMRMEEVFAEIRREHPVAAADDDDEHEHDHDHDHDDVEEGEE
ncbi:MAG: 30S ribosome-binding factor RbfA [Deltaproteobacteria bacterium]|nr:30S ribosome-binding factor RbfA [Deltaproteobacteria bacterium]